jgi:glucose-1-phosphate cytidylyltransferase
MKVVILAGGKGTRIAEETALRPKPMVEIGGYPILWHIMSLYAHQGFKEFVLALGYKGEQIRDYFLRYRGSFSDATVDLASGHVECHQSHGDDWLVSLIDTGKETQTAGRIRRVAQYLGRNQRFMLTYGDGVSDLDLRKLLAFHESHGRIATLTAVRPAARFGALLMEGNQVVEFKEKPQTDEGWVNGGFFVFENAFLDYLSDADDSTVLEAEPLEHLARDGQLMAFQHPGFWHCMDTLRDKERLEYLWQSGNAPWKAWRSWDSGKLAGAAAGGQMP